MTKLKKNYNENIFVKICRVILIIILLPFVIIYSVYRFIVKKKKEKANKEKISLMTISQIDSMTGIEFENFLKDLYEKMGYSVSLTKTTGDYGADLILKKKNKTTIVQAKCYGKTVGLRAIQEIIGARKHYGVNNAMVATNSYFSKQAQELAHENDVKLVDRKELESLINSYEVKFERTKFNFSSISSSAITEIEDKYRYWI